MYPPVKELKKEISVKMEELPLNELKELYDYLTFLELKKLIPQIDPSQAYFWTKKWQSMEREAEDDLKTGKVTGPFKSTKDLLKSLKK